MSKPKSEPKPFPKLERLLVDVDMNKTLLPYLKAVGFDVLFARDTKVNIKSDRALVAYARHYHRILICHDRHQKPQKHKLEVCKEIYQHGGRVIQVAGDPKQDPLTSLGKILANRYKWMNFFNGNDGIVTTYDNREMKTMKREELFYKIEQISTKIKSGFKLDIKPMISPKAPHKPAKRKPNPIPSQQLPLSSNEQTT